MDPTLLSELGDLARLPLELREEIFEYSLGGIGEQGEDEVDLLTPCMPLLYVSPEINAEVNAVMSRLQRDDLWSCKHTLFSCNLLVDEKSGPMEKKLRKQMRADLRVPSFGKHDLRNIERIHIFTDFGLEWKRQDVVIELHWRYKFLQGANGPQWQVPLQEQIRPRIRSFQNAPMSMYAAHIDALVGLFEGFLAEKQDQDDRRMLKLQKKEDKKKRREAAVAKTLD
ncbi:hypothetical protein LTR10_000249 [Elasticomyces elasticus]|nr:hypothetical protein LTR10_000249 [Elasticomyces elasticus]KAK4980495.1 hypothetical protein LTR42_000802 [Elasticomyces elasticus]